MAVQFQSLGPSSLSPMNRQLKTCLQGKSGTFKTYQQHSWRISNIQCISATFCSNQQHFKHISNIHGYVADIFISNIISNMGVPLRSPVTLSKNIYKFIYNRQKTGHFRQFVFILSFEYCMLIS